MCTTMENRRKYYTVIYAQCFSPCHKYLVAASSYGEIAVFAASHFLSNEEEDEGSSRNPFYKFTAHSGSIFAMIMSDEFLISGGNGEIFAWNWDKVKKKSAEKSWALSIPQGESIVQPEVNALVLSGKDSEQTLLIAGCGNNKIYVWDIETRTLLSTLTRHTDYVHDLALASNNVQLYSAGEDGAVLCWDIRSLRREIFHIEPSKHEELQRPRFGKWIGCVGLDTSDEWLVCGGGPTLCIWHIPMSSPATPLTDLAKPAHVAHFYDDMVMAGGGEPNLYHWSFSGDLKAKIETSASSLYSVAFHLDPPHRGLCAAGSSHKIEVCTNFLYRDFSLQF
ncbi:THO complex subunit 6 [Haemaphysalis longicornis]